MTCFFVETCRNGIIIYILLVYWLVIVQNLSDIFPIKNVLKEKYDLSPLLLRSPVRGIQVNQYGLNLNVRHQFLVYADVNILGGSVHTVKKLLIFGSC